MAITMSVDTAEVVSIEEYLDYVRRYVDPADTDSLLESAPMLKKLANDRELVVRKLNEQIKRSLGGNVLSTTQVVFLGEGKDFYVRANIWPSTADLASGRIYQDQFSYDIYHDHNYNFLTATHWGPGYTTEIYEYDREKVEGSIGEHVEFEFLERCHFSGPKVLLYRACRDMHVQFPPEDLTISINLVTSTAEIRTRDQYFFDIATSSLKEFPPDIDISRRASVIQMAAYAGNDETCELLFAIGKGHRCQRARQTAFESLATLSPNDASRIWEIAANDPSRLNAKIAREKLESLSK